MKINKVFKTEYRYVYLLIGISFFSYIFIRAITVGPTIDELGTLRYIHTWSYNTSLTANNHFLNTFLIKFFVFLFGESFFVFRLPNVLAFLVYLYFSFRLVSKNLPHFVALSCFVLLLCNPFLLDFFSLARGYGLSLACMMASLYYGIENIKNYSSKTLIKSLIWAGFSMYAIFSMLYFWCALALALNLAVLLRRDKLILKRSLLYSFCVGFVFLVMVYEPIRSIAKWGGFYYGGTNFYSDSLFSLTKFSLYTTEDSVWITICLIAFLLILAISLILSYVHKKRKVFSIKELLLFIAVAVVCMMFLAHLVRDVLFPIDRSMLFFYPLLILLFCFSVTDLKKRISQIIIYPLVLCLFVNLAININFYKAIIWSFESRNEAILEKINKQGELSNKVMILETSWLFGTSINYIMDNKSFPFVKIKNGPLFKDVDFRESDTDYYMHLSKNVIIYDDAIYKQYIEDLKQYDKDTFLIYPQDNLIVYTNIRPKIND